jgi:DNA transposition AAA+ family ATPase
MEDKFIKTDNYIRIFEAMEELDNLPSHSHKMAIIYGRFGLGKTTIIERLALDTDAALTRTLATWTPKAAMADLCRELGIDEKGTSNTLQNRIIEELNHEPRPIIIDEIDTILTSSMKAILTAFRDIHDKTDIPIVFVGMEESRKILKKEPHYYSRFVKKVEVHPTSKSDIEKYCESSSIKVSDDLIEYFWKKYPNLRQIKTILIRLENYCTNNDFDHADLTILKTSQIEVRDEI